MSHRDMLSRSETMRRVHLSWSICVLLLAGAGSFALGRLAVDERKTGPSRAVSGDKTTKGEVATPGHRVGTTADRSKNDLTSLGIALSRGVENAARQPAGKVSFVETAAEREARHQRISDQITAALGDVPVQKRQALIELNDEAEDIQRKQQEAMLAGTLSHADYMAQMRQAVNIQLDELRAIVTEDEYRKLTGLQPGVDPFDYMRTGEGGAPSAAPPPHRSDVQTSPKPTR